MKKSIRCIKCPIGCEIEVEYNSNEIISIEGAQCPRGESYAKKEIKNPERILTSSIKVKNGDLPLVSVRSDEEIPKEKIFELMEEINKVEVESPVNIGDVLISKPLGLECNIIATKTVNKET